HAEVYEDDEHQGGKALQEQTRPDKCARADRDAGQESPLGATGISLQAAPTERQAHPDECREEGNSEELGHVEESPGAVGRTGATNSATWALEPIAMLTARLILFL